MLSTRALITRLTLRTEYANYALVVAPATYFALIAGHYTFERGLYLVLGAGLGVLLTLLVGIATRLVWLRPLFRALHALPADGGAGGTDGARVVTALHVKRELLRYPAVEGVLVMLRWCVGVITAYIVQSNATGINEREAATLWLTLAYAAPTSGIVLYFITENTLIPVLEDERLARHDLPRERYIIVSMFLRVFLIVTVAAATPGIMLGWLLYLATQGAPLNDYLVLHLAAVFVALIYSLVASVHAATASLRLGLRHSLNAVRNMAEGDLTTFVPMIGADELGDISVKMNQIIRRLGETMRGIQADADRLEKFVGEMKSNSERVRHDTLEQSASIEEVSGALEEMGASAEKIAAHAGAQAEKSEAAHQAMKRLAELGHQIFQETETSARSADDTHGAAVHGNEILQNTAAQMRKIVESTDEIQDAVKVINDIAEQVSMLALNAAIESARAGEFGRGFAVVADEISKLASKTQQNSRRIIALVDESSRRVENGRRFIEDTLAAFAAITSNIDESLERIQSTGRNTSQQVGLSDEVRTLIQASADLAQDIAQAAREQTHSNREFLESVQKISGSTQSVAEVTDRNALMSAELARHAARLREQVEFFRFQ